jgi:hypothetical protein
MTVDFALETVVMSRLIVLPATRGRRFVHKIERTTVYRDFLETEPCIGSGVTTYWENFGGR